MPGSCQWLPSGRACFNEAPAKSGGEYGARAIMADGQNLWGFNEAPAKSGGGIRTVGVDRRTSYQAGKLQ